MVIGHTDCGVQGMDGGELLKKLEERGIPRIAWMLSVTAG